METKNAKQLEQVEQEMMKKWRIPITQNHNLAWKRGNVPDAQLNWGGEIKYYLHIVFFAYICEYDFPYLYQLYSALLIFTESTSYPS